MNNNIEAAVFWTLVAGKLISGQDNDNGSSIALTPPSFNCQPLTPEYQVRWRVLEGGEDIDIQLIGKIPNNGYMAFGVSGNPNTFQMIGSDVAVTDFFGGQPRARDFHIDRKRECNIATVEGVCPDGARPDVLTNDIAENTVGGERQNGLTLVTYRRPATPANANVNVGANNNIPSDLAISVSPGARTSVIWALGLVDATTGNPLYHSSKSTSATFLEFGRTVQDNCSPLAVVGDEEEEDEEEDEEKDQEPEELVPFLRNVLVNVTDFYAHVGPDGGPRGYELITGGRTPSPQGAWYLNDNLIPVVELRRGTTYRFFVNGGPNHPFYLTTSVNGGYKQLDPETRAKETAVAGIQFTNQTADGSQVFDFTPTAVGSLCLYKENGNSKEEAAKSFQAYFQSLNNSCASNTSVTDGAKVLEFTPNDDTPDLLYYQCTTHSNMGWEIHVIDADADSILDVDCSNFESAPIRLTNELTLNVIVNPIENTLTAKLVLKGLAWIGMAFTNGQDRMIGSEAVIGDPTKENIAQVNPAKYNLNAKAVLDVVPMPLDQQTFINASITQESGITTLTFTKKLLEDGKHTIFSEQRNTFLFAHGSSNALAFHAAYGSFQVLPNQCAVRINNVLQNEQALNQQGNVGISGTPNRQLWMAHGACAAVAWGILVPLAIGASLIRKILIRIGMPPSAWFQIHRGLNLLAAILTLIAFSLAVKGINDKADAEHFDNSVNKHPRTGLVIFILTMGQALNGLLRPHIHPASIEKDKEENEAQIHVPGERKHHEETSNSAEEDPRTPANHVAVAKSNNHSSNNNHSKESKFKQPQKGKEEKSIIRFCWEIFHRTLGLTLLGFAWWQVQGGLGLFATKFDEENLDSVFWIVVSCLSGSIVGLAVMARLPWCDKN
ncbi:hypothetical protein ACA910_003630 [Epithemia clementina (nom. ined.)]